MNRYSNVVRIQKHDKHVSQFTAIQITKALEINYDLFLESFFWEKNSLEKRLLEKFIRLSFCSQTEGPATKTEHAFLSILVSLPYYLIQVYC